MIRLMLRSALVALALTNAACQKTKVIPPATSQPAPVASAIPTGSVFHRPIPPAIQPPSDVSLFLLPEKMNKGLILDVMGEASGKGLIVISDAYFKPGIPLLIIEGRARLGRANVINSPLGIKDVATIKLFDEVSFKKQCENCPDPVEAVGLLSKSETFDITGEIYATLSGLYDKIPFGAPDITIKIRIEGFKEGDNYIFQISSVKQVDDVEKERK